MPDTEHYLNDMRETTLEYARKWNLVALRIGNGYTKAYKKQQTALDKIQKAIAAARAREEAMMSFTLGLLTGGIVGPIANRIVKKLTKGGELSLLKDAADKASEDSLVTEWTGEAFKELVKLGDSKLRELGVERFYPKSSPSGGNAFAPVAMAPLEYITSLQIGIESRADFMSDVARVFHRTLYSIPPEAAQAVQRAFFSSSFFKALPSPEALNEEKLQRSAGLMQWIGWAKMRDLDYWDKQHALRGYGFSEEWQWAPLLQELSGLGVSTSFFATTAWGTPTGRWKMPVTINMPAFIRWAKSPLSLTLAFAGLGTNSEGLQQAYSRIAS